MLLYGMYVLCGLGLCDTDGISTACHADADIFLPVRGVQSVDADNALNSAVINFLQRMVQGVSCCILLVLCHCVLQIQHDGIRSVDVRILDQARLLAV